MIVKLRPKQFHELAALEIFGLTKAEATEIRSFVNYNVQFLDAPFSAEVKGAQPFFQCDTDGYMLIEFWSVEQAWRKCVKVLKQRFGWWTTPEKAERLRELRTEWWDKRLKALGIPLPDSHRVMAKINGKQEATPLNGTFWRKEGM